MFASLSLAGYAVTRCADCVHVPYPHSSACKLLIKPFVIPAIQLLTSIIAKIVYLFHMDDHILDLLYQIIYQMKRIKCNGTVDCMYPTSNKYDDEFGALPVATRCWADYYPEVDTSNSFACTASDTCRVSNLDYGETLNSYGFLVEDGNQIVCDACPLQPGGLINQFGCDTYTKQCTCNRSVPHAFLAQSTCAAYDWFAYHPCVERISLCDACACPKFDKTRPFR